MSGLSKLFHEIVDSFEVPFKNVEWENKETYGFWLTQQTALVRHTTRYICLAAARTPISDRPQHNEWLHHLKGELNHDLVALKDLENLGYSENSFPLLKETLLIRQSQYYWLQNHNPVSLCGYSLLLEGLACKLAPVVIKRLSTKMKKDQYAFLSLHANVDVAHFKEGLEFISHKEGESSELIRCNLEQSAFLYKSLLSEVARGAAHPSNRMHQAKAA